MFAYSVNPPFPIFTGSDGTPLDDAYIYIGTANQNPVSNPITVYWDATLTIPASQPIRTNAGYPVYNGSPARFYVASNYSILVRDKNGAFVYTAANESDQATGFSASYSSQSITATLNQTVFNLDFGYTLGNNSLAVYQNGARLVHVSDYVETDANTVTLKIGASDGDVLQFVGATEINPSTMDSASVSYAPAGTGAVPTNVQTKLRETVSVKDFGAVGDGTTNDSAALLAFYNYCISSGLSGHILAGTYKVTPGVLIFDNNFTDKTWPVITTDGPQAVVFNIDTASTVDSAVLCWRNGTATGAAGKYWRGGYHGGLTIKDTRAGTYLNTHGIKITGTWGLEFGQVFADGLQGAVVHVPQNLYASTNPDPYASSLTKFDVIKANNCGYAIWNENWLGMDSWTVNAIYATNGKLGVVQGIGGGCSIGILAAGSCLGWVFDDGTQSASTGGTPFSNSVGAAEIDNCQNGIRLNKTYNNTFQKIRFIHRFQTSPNATAKYWPLKAVDICAGSSPSVFNNEFQIRHRISAGGTTSDLGTFVGGNNSTNIANLVIDEDFTDEGSIGVTNAFLFSSFNRNSSAKISARSKVIYNSMDLAISFARGSASSSIPNSGYGSVSSKIAFPTQVYTSSSSATLYDTTTYIFTAPRAGLYSVNVSLPLAVAIGTRVRIGLMINTNVAITKIAYSVNAGTVSYDLTGSVFLNSGDTAYVTADQNTGGAVSCSPVFSNDEVRFVMNEIGF